eukprot:1210275-Rhodomonas_salina.1
MRGTEVAYAGLPGPRANRGAFSHVRPRSWYPPPEILSSCLKCFERVGVFLRPNCCTVSKNMYLRKESLGRGGAVDINAVVVEGSTDTVLHIAAAAGCRREGAAGTQAATKGCQEKQHQQYGPRMRLAPPVPVGSIAT